MKLTSRPRVGPLTWARSARRAGPHGAAVALALALTSTLTQGLVQAQTGPAHATPPLSTGTAPSGLPSSPLGQALAAAWLRAPEAVQAQGRLARAQAEDLVTRQAWVGPGALAWGQRLGPSGAWETEVAWSQPLWRPGQRAASASAAQAELAWAQATEAAGRWRLAGQLREAAGAIALAQAELQQAEQQVEALTRLATDVDRRVQAGDLAPADSLAVRAEEWSARALASAARDVLRARQAHWQMLTGLADAPPLPATDTVRTAPPLRADHPELRLSEAAMEMARQRAGLTRDFRAESPEVSVATSHEQSGGGSQTRVTVGLRLPLGGTAYRQPAIAAALADMELAQVQLERTRERLRADLSLAWAHLEASQAQLQSARERARLLETRAQMINKSFQAGESPLPDLLRALQASAEAASGLTRQTAALALARTRVDHALGNLP